MVSFIITIFISLFLVTQKILLLNEESLILLCFITFVTFGVSNLSKSINNSFQAQSDQIEQTLRSSLIKLLNIFNNFLSIKNSFKTLGNKFLELKFYYKKFVKTLGNKFQSCVKIKLVLSYNRKLNFINKIENKTINLLTFIVVKKLNKIIKLKKFYNSSIKITQFLCLNTILIRECIQLINFSKKN